VEGSGWFHDEDFPAKSAQKRIGIPVKMSEMDHEGLVRAVPRCA
jgi:hypothetical protein